MNSVLVMMSIRPRPSIPACTSANCSGLEWRSSEEEPRLCGSLVCTFGSVDGAVRKKLVSTATSAQRRWLEEDRWDRVQQHWLTRGPMTKQTEIIIRTPVSPRTVLTANG